MMIMVVDVENTQDDYNVEHSTHPSSNCLTRPRQGQSAAREASKVETTAGAAFAEKIDGR